jgi:hypothetical protein
MEEIEGIHREGREIKKKNLCVLKYILAGRP